MPSTFSEWIGLAILAIVAVIVLGILGYLAVGLFQARSLVRREFTAYFLSPIAYVVLVVFLAVIGFLFTLTLNQLTATGPDGVEFPLQYMIGEQWLFWLVFLIIPPLLTMRLFAEERSTGTLEMLMTAPVRDWQLVLSKYVACFAFYVLMWLPTLIYVPVLVDAGWPPTVHDVWTGWSIALMAGLVGIVAGLVLLFVPGDASVRLLGSGLLVAGIVATSVGGWYHYHRDAEHLFFWEAKIASGSLPVVSTYLGLALAGAMLLAIGLLVSSLVRNQLVAALVSLALGLAFIVTGFWRPDIDTGSTLGRALFFVSIPQHFSRDFCRGLVDTRHLTLYVSVAVFSLFLTVRSLESRRWR
jgi:ABC-type transport system involved in multi-copper enzyme maturation permease subunit